MANRTAEQQLGLYAEGWTQGDVRLILEAASKRFVFYNGDALISRAAFPDFFATFKTGNRPFSAEKFMDIQAVATTVQGGRLVAACFWRTGSLQGTGLIVVNREGVLLEKVQLVMP